MTSGDWQAIAEWVTAATVLVSAIGWAWRQRRPVAGWLSRARRQFMALMSREVAAGEAWNAVSVQPEVSMEAGIAFARTIARSGHAPYTPTQGAVTPDQPLEYLLAKVAETAWNAASAVQQELEPYLVPPQQLPRRP